MFKPKSPQPFSKQKAQIKTCSASKETIVFSYAHICKDDRHNFNCFKRKRQNSKMAEVVSALNNKLSEISNLTWERFNAMSKKCGMEYMQVGEMDETFIHSLDYHLTKDDKLISVRFNAQDCRLILKRGSKCNRVAQVLGIDIDLDLYRH